MCFSVVRYFFSGSGAPVDFEALLAVASLRVMPLTWSLSVFYKRIVILARDPGKSMLNTRKDKSLYPLFSQQSQHCHLIIFVVKV